MARERAQAGERERGTITLWILGLCLMLFLLGGISLDLWRSFSERRALAATADAAALAGASAIDEDRYRQSGEVVLVPTEAEARARASIAAQLDKDALRGVEVRATTEVVTVVARGRVGLTLLNLLHTADVDVVVTATATPRRSS
jgi:Flp pilus assembly protein TadG